MNAAAQAPLCTPDLSALYVMQDVASFSRTVDRFDREAGIALLTNRRLRPLQEALVLRDYALTLACRQCRLCPPEQQFPDGEVVENNGTLKIEITEMMEEGRNRDAEYKAIERTGARRRRLAHLEQEELRRNGERWPKWLLEAIHRKLKYGPGIGYDIVVYNNVHLFSLPELPEVATAVQRFMNDLGFYSHRVWHYRQTRLDQLHPRFGTLEVPGASARF